MTKRLLALSGLAILAVVLNHTAGYGMIALFLWADRYLPVEVPYWDPLGSVTHYALLVARSLGVFAVPAFLFVAGFFSAYIARGTQPRQRQWRVVTKRITALVVPYLVWSTLILVGDAVQGIIYSPSEYFTKLLATGASDYLFFVPLLCICYFLSPWIVNFARKRPRLLLSVSIFLQAGPLVARYLDLFSIRSSFLIWVIRITPDWSIPRWITFFSLGSIVALNTRMTKKLLTRYRRLIVALVIVSWLLNIAEGSYLLQIYRSNWTAGVSTISYHIFALSVIACSLAFAEIDIPGSVQLQELSKRSYGVYLMHMPIVDFVARVIRQLAPEILAHQSLLVPLLFCAGLAIPILTMESLGRLQSGRRAYRYLFG